MDYYGNWGGIGCSQDFCIYGSSGLDEQEQPWAFSSKESEDLCNILIMQR